MDRANQDRLPPVWLLLPDNDIKSADYASQGITDGGLYDN